MTTIGQLGSWWLTLGSHCLFNRHFSHTLTRSTSRTKARDTDRKLSILIRNKVLYYPSLGASIYQQNEITVLWIHRIVILQQKCKLHEIRTFMFLDLFAMWQVICLIICALLCEPADMLIMLNLPGMWFKYSHK